MLATLLICIISYFIGAIPTGFWVGKLLKGIDIRTVGSGSTGATNVLRSVGKGPAIFVLVFDLCKGMLPVLLGIAACISKENPAPPPWHGQIFPLPDFLMLTAGSQDEKSPSHTYLMQFMIKNFIPATLGAIISMIGHSKSIFLNFQGGKSAATGLGTLTAMHPLCGVCTFIVFVSTIYVGRFVSLGSMLAAASGPFFMYYFTHGQLSFVIYNVIGSSYVIIRHKSNIQRLLAGTEPKIGQKVDTNKTPPPADADGQANSTQDSVQSSAQDDTPANHNGTPPAAGHNGAPPAGPGADQSDPPANPPSANPKTAGAILLLLALAFSPFQSAYSADDASAGNKRTSIAEAKKAKAKDSTPSSGEVFITAPPATITPEEANNIKLYKTDSPAVVNVTSSKVTPEMVMFGISPQASDTGSGSIISPDGYVLTNFHVINGASMVRVTLFDGTPFMATVVGTDPQNDLAVLKIDAGARKLSVIKFGDSSKLEVGRRIYAIGNPFGLDLTMTSGIISSVGRTLKTEAGHVIKGVLQVDAAINPGNSGGPLLDSQGNMVGVTTAILSKVQQSAGIGFAIPINVVKQIVPQLIAHGVVLRPDTGILQVRPIPGTGLMVVAIDPAGPAAEAGLKGPTVRKGKAGAFEFTQVDNSTADIIVGIDNQHVATVDDLLSYVETKKPGQVVTLNVLRQGTREVARIPLKLAETKLPNG